MAKSQGYEIETEGGKKITVYKIEDQEMAKHIRNKGFYPHNDARPQTGGYYAYDSFGEGSYIVFDEDFVENQLDVENDMEK